MGIDGQSSMFGASPGPIRLTLSSGNPSLNTRDMILDILLGLTSDFVDEDWNNTHMISDDSRDIYIIFSLCVSVSIMSFGVVHQVVTPRCETISSRWSVTDSVELRDEVCPKVLHVTQRKYTKIWLIYIILVPNKTKFNGCLMKQPILKWMFRRFG